MKEIKLETVEVDHESYSGWTSGLAQKTVATLKEELIREDVYQEFKQYVAEISSVKNLIPGEKVYFDGSVMFPRTKFKKSYPDNKIVYSIGEADVVIVDVSKIKDEFVRSYKQTFYLCKNGHFSRDVGYAELVNPKKEFIFSHIYSSYRSRESQVARMNEVYKMEGCKFLDVKYISLSSEKTLNLDNFERLSKMFGGGDDGMRNMAMSILTAYDYETEKYKIHALLKLYWAKWERGKKKKNIEIKSMLRKLELDFGEFSKWYDDFDYWMKVTLNYPEDEVMIRAFNIWMKGKSAELPNVKLIKI